MLGEKIKTYRQKKGYTQEEVANRLHVTRQTISKWEKNYSVPDAEVFVKLADVLEVQTSQLLGVKVDSDVQTALAVQKDAPVSARWRTYMRDVIRMERDPKSGAQPHLEQVFFFGCDTCT